MMRERMSRPSSSVPSRWSQDGFASSALKSVAEAEYGATHGAKIAARMKIARDGEAEQRGRPPGQALADEPAAAGAGGEEVGCVLDDRHDGLATIRIRGFSSE